PWSYIVPTTPVPRTTIITTAGTRSRTPGRQSILPRPIPFFFFKQKTAYEIGLGIPAEPLFRSICHCEHFHPEVAAHSDSEQLLEIGRASCRERVEMSVVGVSFKKKDDKDHRIAARRADAVGPCTLLMQRAAEPWRNQRASPRSA